MKKWVSEVIAVLILACNVSPLGAAELPQNGKEIVLQAEEEYRNGKYDDFLAKLHEHYQSAGKAGVVRGVFESAKAAILSSGRSLEISDSSLVKERDQLLREAVAKNPELGISKRVQAVLSHNLASEHRDILAELEGFKYRSPETALPTAGNKIAALETEYYIKTLLLQIGNHRSGGSAEDLYKKKVVLALQKLDKMDAEARNYESQEWIEKVAKAKEAFRADSSYKIDYDVLKSLANGQIETTNSVEENVKHVMLNYLAQSQSDLSREVAQN